MKIERPDLVVGQKMKPKKNGKHNKKVDVNEKLIKELKDGKSSNRL